MKKSISLVLLLFATMLIVHALAAETPFDGMRTYQAGQYKAGRDFIAGEYVLLSISDFPGYFAISSDANQQNIIANDLFDVNSIITIYDGEYLELSRCIAIYAADFYSSYTIKTNQDGTMLKIGYDILPGEYKLIAGTEYPGYYCIYSNSRRDEVIANDLFDNSAWVTLSFGQYIELSRCHIQ